ncbi:LamB/YcsF family protein [Brevibacillus invocatus]|uniref:LamB/YcsF family protein n=1 Tax=Brevibacillus invocatus TaxID=173959 RepID=UPI0020407078|nr:5-oxoprolinase subunit PxpA [Brevibacillus invocatus]MCM3081582.1 5-oxoprolinase subunit PxpA [Brevibacillus invocatus]MCM3431957.1 5-oxoprolinase subunit PxpA [Brevibacillus invocatus]
MYVDLNCDMGESFGNYQLGNDEEMMKLISSANIACGYHAGDPHVMRKSVQLAKEYGVSIGSHPGFPDMMGFGRRYMTCTAEEIRDYIIYQTGALREFAKAYKLDLDHCKPHGALYMMAMSDEKIAQAILEGLAMISEKLVIFALNGSAVAWMGQKMGIPVALEVFADREHTEDGSIVLTRTGPTFTNPQDMADRAVRMVKEGKVRTPDGKEAHVKADTICIHGDTPGAVEITKAIHAAFQTEGIEIRSVKKTWQIS